MATPSLLPLNEGVAINSANLVLNKNAWRRIDIIVKSQLGLCLTCGLT